jgi:hypothetical protein
VFFNAENAESAEEGLGNNSKAKVGRRGVVLFGCSPILSVLCVLCVLCVEIALWN